MGNVVYIASDNTAMEREHLEDWLSSSLKLHPECSNWDFDDITGGKDNFLDLKSYESMKEIFTKNI